MLTAFIVTSILCFALCWSAMPKAQFRRLLLDNRGGPGDGDGGAFKIESKQQLEDIVATVTGQIVAQRIKSIKNEIATEIKTTFGEAGKAQQAQFEELRNLISQGGGKKRKKNADGGEAGDEGGDEADTETANAVRTMKRRIEELETANKREQEARKAADQKRQNMQMRSRVREILEQSGVSNPMSQKAAMAMLIDSERLIEWDEGADEPAYKDSDGGHIDIELGLRTWLKTPDGEHFLSPSGVAGAGTRPKRGAQPPEGPKKVTEGEIGLALLSAFNQGGSNG